MCRLRHLEARRGDVHADVLELHHDHKVVESAQIKRHFHRLFL